MNTLSSRLQWMLILLLTFSTLYLWNQVGELSSKEVANRDSEPARAYVEKPEELELHAEMAALQTFLHKLSFSLEEENEPLSHFYLHEMEETIEGVVNADLAYEGFAVSDLMDAMLLPSFESLEAGVEAEAWQEIPESLNVLVRSCNQCHQATNHGEIVITARAESNPYNQDFSTRP